jgi:hypothetical protein
VDVFLIIVCIVFTVLSMACGLYIVFMFQHKEEGFTGCYSIFCRIVITLGIGIATMNVLLLPLDALNRASRNTVNIELMCWIFTITSAGFVFIILPFAISYYEGKEDPSVKSPICRSLCCLIPFVLFVGIFCIILWFAVGYCEIPITRQSSSLVTDPAALSAPCHDCCMSHEESRLLARILILNRH